MSQSGVSKQTETRRRSAEKLHPLQIHFGQTAELRRGKPHSGSASRLAAQLVIALAVAKSAFPSCLSGVPNGAAIRSGFP